MLIQHGKAILNTEGIVYVRYFPENEGPPELHVGSSGKGGNTFCGPEATAFWLALSGIAVQTEEAK